MDSNVKYPNVSGFDESYDKGQGVVSVPYQHKIPSSYINNIQNQYYQNIAPPANNYNYNYNNTNNNFFKHITLPLSYQYPYHDVAIFF